MGDSVIARQWRAVRIGVLATVAATLIATACTSTGGAVPTDCSYLFDSLVADAQDSVEGVKDRSHLGEAWRLLAIDLLRQDLLNLCSGDPELAVLFAPVPTQTNGTVISVKPVVPSPFDPENSIAAKVIYVTETANGAKAYAMTMMAINADDVINGVNPDQLVYAHGTAGINAGCDQAVDQVNGANFIPELVGTESAAVPDAAEVYLSDGKVVQAPYYIGLGPTWSGSVSPYLARETTGRTIIDGVRAVASIGASLDWGVVGHSQGGHAALAAADLAPTYGSDTNLVGSVALAPALDLEGTFDYLLASVDGQGTTGDPYPNDGAAPPDSPTVMTLAGHLFWGLRADVGGLPDPGSMMNPFFLYNSARSIYFNELRLESVNPFDPSFLNSGDPPTWNETYGMYTSGPSAVPDTSVAGQMMFTPPPAALSSGFEDLDWKYTAWSIPRADRLVMGCGWPGNASTGGVMFQYAVNYGSGQMEYPAGVWENGLPMIFNAPYSDQNSPAWNGVRSILRDQSVVDHEVEGPILVTSGDLDPLFPTGQPGTVDPHTTRANVAAMCASGSEVQLLNDPNASHGGAAANYVGQSSSWLLDRFDGVAIDPTDVCSNL